MPCNAAIVLCARAVDHVLWTCLAACHALGHKVLDEVEVLLGMSILRMHRSGVSWGQRLRPRAQSAAGTRPPPPKKKQNLAPRPLPPPRPHLKQQQQRSKRQASRKQAIEVHQPHGDERLAVQARACAAHRVAAGGGCGDGWMDGWGTTAAKRRGTPNPLQVAVRMRLDKRGAALHY